MKYRRRRRIEIDTSSSHSGQMMNLSLFVMLLAFFIVLNSISTFEEKKAAQVRRSVDMAFSNDVEFQEFSPSVEPDEQQSVNDGDSFERIEALFQSQIVTFEMTKSKSQGVMMVKVPYHKFKKAVMALNQEDLTRTPTRAEARGNYFLPTLVSLLKTNIEGSPTRMEIYLNVEQNPARLKNIKPQEMSAYIDEVGVFSTQLEKQNIPQKLLNIGISKGDPEFIDLVFRKYIPFVPLKKEGESS